jgi:hypothetical protein
MTENAIAGAEGALRESCGTMAFESFLGEASEADFDRVRLSLPELKEQIELKDQLCKEARLKRQKLESELERRCQTEIVNEAAARRESAAATIAEYANEYARVRIKRFCCGRPSNSIRRSIRTRCSRECRNTSAI